MSALTARLQAVKESTELEARIAAKLATGKFTDTGAKYSAQQAVSDHNNSALRMTASINQSGSLVWSK
jgi:hypothetical protein